MKNLDLNQGDRLFLAILKKVSMAADRQQKIQEL